MDPIVRNVRDINSSERRVLEHVLGQQLEENQQVIVQIVTLGMQPAEEERQPTATSAAGLPEWCNVYEGLTDRQVAEIEEVILQRADLTRPSE